MSISLLVPHSMAAGANRRSPDVNFPKTHCFDYSENRQRARERAKLLAACLCNQDRLADADRELAVYPQRRRDVEHHAGAQGSLDALVETEHLPLTPVRRER